jgi:hypothetical protein
MYPFRAGSNVPPELMFNANFISTGTQTTMLVASQYRQSSSNGVESYFIGAYRLGRDR